MSIQSQSPYKILEINVISAQDLPPLSKTMRTFAVAWLNRDHKLTTRVDHNGYTNPTWNYKLSFRVDDKFLNSEASSVTFEIYNVAWLRDLPIGTTRLMVNALFPPLSTKNPTMRSAALHICRPSGHLQGILNIGVQLIDMGTPEISHCNELSSPVFENLIDEKFEKSSVIILENEINSKNQMEKMEEDKNFKMGISDLDFAKRTPNVSFCSGVQPIPSEVAEDLKKGLYFVDQGEEIEYGSSVLEDWSAPGDSEKETESMKSKSLTWGSSDDKVHLQDRDDGENKARRRRKHHSDGGGGLFSCFGKAYGFEFNFICGSKCNKKRKRDKKLVEQEKTTFPYTHSEENLRKFYI